MAECVQNGKNVELGINKAYAFHALNSRGNLELINKAIRQAFGEGCVLVLNLQAKNVTRREGNVPQDPTRKKSQKADPKRTGTK